MCSIVFGGKTSVYFSVLSTETLMAHRTTLTTMRNSVTRLFSGQHIYDFRREQEQEMRDEIFSLSKENMENTDDYLSLVFTQKYSPLPIKLQEPKKEDAGEVEITTWQGHDPVAGRMKAVETRHRLKLKLPFEGERELFLKCPSSSKEPRPIYNELHSDEVVYYIDYKTKNREPESIQSEIEREIENWTEKVEYIVEQLNEDIQNIRNRLDNEARRRLQTRREKLNKKETVLSKIGVDSANEPDLGYVEPDKKRNIEFPPSSDSDKGSHSLREKTFREILGIIDDLGTSIERSKETIRESDEESIRDIFLIGINSHYGVATGEGFNRGGKTDILLRYDNKNLFVAECKFWRGQSRYKETIDQLLENLTAADSHAALLIFSNKKDIETVREKVRHSTKKHSLCKSYLSEYYNNRIYEFNLRSGSSAKVAVKTFDLFT